MEHKVKTKIETVLEKIESYKLMVKISNIIPGDQGSFGVFLKIILNDLVYLKYVPIISVDVERSFSVYKI